MSAVGSGPGANGDLRATLVGPKGEKVSLGNTQYCNPFVRIALDCLYATGVDPATPGTGIFSGNIDNSSGLNPTFRGTNPMGTWKLNVWDTSPMGTNTLGSSTPQVKAISQSAKDKKKKKKNDN